jgi:murein DD-endopeptidase MepM/ murein hydrolase activator NlpD
LKFDARISSHFSLSRLHPVLGVRRPHYGTDYAAPAGAPVQAIGEGVVTLAGWNGDAGNMVTVKHAGSYETQYLHLARVFVRRGQRVAQGQVIGLVGSTGLSTGAHLDFRVRRNGSYVNFERLRLPRLETLGGAEKEAFDRHREQYLAMLRGEAASGEELASASGPNGAEGAGGAGNRRR